jgi:hypothetical protein
VRRRLAAAMATAAAAVGLLVAAPSASAFVGLVGSPSMGDSHVVGEVDKAGELSISNLFTTLPDGDVTLTSIVLYPSCGTDAQPCPGGEADPGVFAVDPVATGRATTQCAGVTFTTSIADPTFGSYAFAPSSPVVLSGGATCTIDFTFDVLKVPTEDSDAAAGLQTESGATVTGQSVNSGTSQLGGDTMTVAKANTVLALNAASPVPLGSPVTATASLLQTANPTDDVAFSLFGPSDPACAGPAIFGAVVPVSGSSATSPPFVPTATGTYRWTASYGGDANNNADAAACGEAGTLSEVVVPSAAATGQRAAALKKCKKKKSKKKRKKCRKRALRLPV